MSGSGETMVVTPGFRLVGWLLPGSTVGEGEGLYLHQHGQEEDSHDPMECEAVFVFDPDQNGRSPRSKDDNT